MCFVNMYGEFRLSGEEGYAAVGPVWLVSGWCVGGTSGCRVGEKRGERHCKAGKMCGKVHE
jgi:hypothetical protein